MNSKMGLLTMCRKAGKLQLGMDMVKDSCRNGSAFGVFTANDLSPKSMKEVKFVCSKYDIKLYELGLSMDEIWADLGKKSGSYGGNRQRLLQILRKGTGDRAFKRKRL